MERDVGIRKVSIEDPDYPENLRDTEDPPCALFVRGSLLPSDRTAVALVGTRSPTPLGKNLAFEIARDLASVGVTIVSGLAMGIDAAAHRGALDGEGRTIACLGTGVDVPYPRMNAVLFTEIAEKGALVSEYEPGTPALPWRFPRRNRIIAGLSLGVVVVEAGERSGALITADLALRMGRPVMAVPGSPKSRASAGCNRLIQEGAYLVTCAQDVLDFLAREGEWVPQGSSTRERPMNVSLEEGAILEVLSKEPLTADQLAEKMPEIDPGRLLSVLTMLEMRGIVSRAAGGAYLADNSYRR